MTKRDQIYDRIAVGLPINAVVMLAAVDDPYEPGAHITALRSIRTDPFARMVGHGQIDNVQFAAGRLWQLYRERSEIGGHRGIDPTRIAVDGGKSKEPDISNLSAALVKLSLANEMLQAYEASLVYDVLARNMSISEIAAARAISSGRQVMSLMETFRAALDVLAVCYGLSTEEA